VARALGLTGASDSVGVRLSAPGLELRHSKPGLPRPEPPDRPRAVLRSERTAAAFKNGNLSLTSAQASAALRPHHDRSVPVSWVMPVPVGAQYRVLVFKLEGPVASPREHGLSRDQMQLPRSGWQ